MASANQGDGFTEVTHRREKRKASTSPTLPSQSTPGSSESQYVPKPYRKNIIPVIISGVYDKFKTRRKLMGELRQYHPSLKISSIKELPKEDFVATGDSVQDVIVLQNETK